jgi:predicted transposase YdaD
LYQSGVLAKFLTLCGSEVSTVLFEELSVEDYREEYREEGREEGRKEGRKETVNRLRELVGSGYSYDEALAMIEDAAKAHA